MMGFFEWVLEANRWVMPSLFFILMTVWWWVLSKSGNLRDKVIFGVLMVGFLGIVMNYWIIASEYHNYKNNWETCAKPEARAAMYAFDNTTQKCMKPFIGYVPVESDLKELVIPKNTPKPEGEWI